MLIHDVQNIVFSYLGEIVFGGETSGDEKYIAPTVVKDVPFDDSLMKEYDFWESCFISSHVNDFLWKENFLVLYCPLFQFLILMLEFNILMTSEYIENAPLQRPYRFSSGQPLALYVFTKDKKFSKRGDFHWQFHVVLNGF